MYNKKRTNIFFSPYFTLTILASERRILCVSTQDTVSRFHSPLSSFALPRYVLSPRNSQFIDCRMGANQNSYQFSCSEFATKKTILSGNGGVITLVYMFVFLSAPPSPKQNVTSRIPFVPSCKRSANEREKVNDSYDAILTLERFDGLGRLAHRSPLSTPISMCLFPMSVLLFVRTCLKPPLSIWCPTLENNNFLLLIPSEDAVPSVKFVSFSAGLFNLCHDFKSIDLSGALVHEKHT